MAATLDNAGTNQSQSGRMSLSTHNFKAPALGAVISAEKLLKAIYSVPLNIP